MLNYKFKISLYFLLFNAAYASGQIAGIEQISTHPAADYAPAISPDGRWAAFVSERSGNKDIWIKKLPRGRAVQITSHPAEDFSPAWMPDSRGIVFVSKRRDAAGDIWKISINSENGSTGDKQPHQISRYLGADLQPVVTTDGKYIVFSSDRRNKRNIWKMSLEGQELQRLTIDGGLDPALSPSGRWLVFVSSRFHPQGDLLLLNMDEPEEDVPQKRRAIPLTWGESVDSEPFWAYKQSAIIFSRIDEDSDLDGRITPEDNRSLWIKQLSKTDTIDSGKIILGRDEIKITSFTSDDFSPCCSHDDLVFYTSGFSNNLDIYTIPFGGLFPRASDAAAQYKLAQQFEPKAGTTESLTQLLLAYERVQDFFPADIHWSMRAANQISSILASLGRSEEAAANLHTLIRVQGRKTAEMQRIELQLATISQASLDERIERCNALIQEALVPEVAAEAELLLGDLLYEKGNIGEAAAAFSRAAEMDQTRVNIAARAGLKLGDMFARQGQETTARESWLSVLRNYGNIPIWRERAGQRILDLVTGKREEKIAGFQRIVDRMVDFPALAVKAQLETAELLMEQEAWSQARIELERVPVIAPTEVWAEARSKILLAVVMSHQREELKAYLLLEEVTENFKFTDGGRYSQQAVDTLFNLYIKSAERLALYGDFFLAGVRYKRASRLKPANIAARRGYIAAAAGNHQLPQVIAEYEQELKKSQTDKITLYSLGLAWSYLGQEDPVKLKESNRYLLKALEDDYQLIYPYRTLGYNYELLENLFERQRLEKPGLLKKIGKVLLAPVKMVAGIFGRGKQEQTTGYYEKAIEVLSTALELNDEVKDPVMEAHLTQNLANNFYHLGEFGYKKAFKYYSYRLSLDTTFTSDIEKASFYERAGRCGLNGDNVEQSLQYLKRAVDLYTNLGRKKETRRNKRMMALLHQLSENYENAVLIYEELAVKDEAEGRLFEAERGYRNIAFNYHLLGEPDLVLQYGLKAEAILDKIGFEIKPVSGNKLRIEILGLSIPVWTMDEIGGASSEGLTAGDEAALIFGLISRSYESLKSFQKAFTYEQKRLNLFEKQKDKLARRISIHRLGKLSFQWARYKQSWEFFNHSRRLCKKNNDMNGMLLNILNQSSTALAFLQTAENDTLVRKAINLCGNVLKKKYKNYIMSNENRSALLGAMGSLNLGLAKSLPLSADPPAAIRALKLFSRADSCFFAALAFDSPINSRGEIFKNMAEIRHLSGEIESAFDYTDKSLAVLQIC